VIELTEHGRDWAVARRDLNLMAEVVLDPDSWPEGFVRLARRYANAAGAEYEAKGLFRILVEADPERTLELLRSALSGAAA